MEVLERIAYWCIIAVEAYIIIEMLRSPGGASKG